MGGFAPYSLEIDRSSAVDQDFEITVLSAVTDRYRLKLYVQLQDLTGERMLDENTRIWCKVQRDTGEENVLSDCVAFDPDTHTALFEINEEREEPSDLQEDIRFWVGYVWPQVYEFATSEPLPKELISKEVLDSMTLDDGQVVLKPGQTPAPLSGFDKASLSSMGFAADGTFQVLVQLADGGLLESMQGRRESLLLTNLYLDGAPNTDSEDIRFELDGNSYMGISFPNVSPEDLDQLTLSDAYGTVLMSEPIFGEWEVPFQVEKLSSDGTHAHRRGRRGAPAYPTDPDAPGRHGERGVGDGVSRKRLICGGVQRRHAAGTGADQLWADESYQSLYFRKLAVSGASGPGRSGGTGAGSVVYPADRRKCRRRLSH